MWYCTVHSEQSFSKTISYWFQLGEVILYVLFYINVFYLTWIRTIHTRTVAYGVHFRHSFVKLEKEQGRETSYRNDSRFLFSSSQPGWCTFKCPPPALCVSVKDCQSLPTSVISLHQQPYDKAFISPLDDVPILQKIQPSNVQEERTSRGKMFLSEIWCSSEKCLTFSTPSQTTAQGSYE